MYTACDMPHLVALSLLRSIGSATLVRVCVCCCFNTGLVFLNCFDPAMRFSFRTGLFEIMEVVLFFFPFMVTRSRDESTLLLQLRNNDIHCHNYFNHLEAKAQTWQPYMASTLSIIGVSSRLFVQWASGRSKLDNWGFILTIHPKLGTAK